MAWNNDTPDERRPAREGPASEELDTSEGGPTGPRPEGPDRRGQAFEAFYAAQVDAIRAQRVLLERRLAEGR